MFGGPGYYTYRHKHGVTVMPITMVAECRDCAKRYAKQRNVDMFKVSVGLKGDWCLLKRSVWERVWPGTAQKRVNDPMPMKYNLCIEHIEARLGRRLTRADFDLRSAHNRPDDKRRQFPMSKRLRDRLRRNRRHNVHTRTFSAPPPPARRRIRRRSVRSCIGGEGLSSGPTAVPFQCGGQFPRGDSDFS
jgi:hypothetical protein